VPAVAILVAIVLGNFGLSASSSGQAATNPCDLVASTAGSNTNPGTLTQPVRTVQRLIDMLGPGQTGCLRGTAANVPFLENVSISNKNASSGSEATRIELMSYPGEVAKIRGTVTLSETANFITLSHLALEARNPLQQLLRIEGDEIVVADNNLSGAQLVGCVRIGGNAVSPAFRTTIVRTRIRDCLDGVVSISSRDLLVERNAIFDNNGWGLRLEADAKASGVVYNIFDGNTGGLQFSGDSSTASTGTIVDHNVFSNSSPSSWNVSATWHAANVPATYSSFVTRSCSYDPDRPSTAGINNAAGGFMPVAPIINQNPQYRDREAKDFHLDPSSPCHDVAGDIAQAIEDGGGPNDEEASANHSAPNVLVIVTDDHRAAGTVTQSQNPQQIMPAVVEGIREKGTNFPNAFATTPLCCPSRATIMSGRYAHNHIVTNNFGAWNFDENPTMQAYLDQEGGYRTGIYGKYLNDWDLKRDPQHWDHWGIFNGGYCPFRVNEDGAIVDYGVFNQPTIAECGAYTTSYVRDNALNFIDDGEATDSQPWMLYLAPFAPHGPSSPDDQYADFDVGPFPYGPAHDEAPGNPTDPNTDKPDYVRAGFSPGNVEENVRRQELRSLKSVDDMVGDVLERLEERGEQDTLVVFVSDNGMMWGEHGLNNKAYPYTESINIPLSVRYSPLTIPGSTDNRLVGNLDVAPTALRVAGLSTTRTPAIDGLSLFDPANTRNRLHLEQANHNSYPTTDGFRNWASTRTATYQYIESYAENGVTIVFREYYDLVNDPEQRFNLYGPDGQPGGGDDLGTPDQPVSLLEQQLLRDRLCVGTQCPPGPGALVTATDTTAPDVQITQPAAGGYVCCRVKLSAEALDNLGVTSLQFMVDGAAVGPELTQEPFSTIWDTTGVTPGQHQLTAVARDAAGNTRTSAVAPINVSDMDVQVDNGPGIAGKVDTGDTVTFSYGRPIAPGTVALGWNGTQPASCEFPAPGCVTVGILADDRYDGHGTDSLEIYRDSQRTVTDPLNQPLTSLGKVDLGVDTYVGATASFLRSPMELINGDTAIRITLADGAVAAGPFPELGTMKWKASSAVRDTSNNPFCINCTVFESILPWVHHISGDTIDDEDREF
jgi:arylsulfatase A-like enzyme